MCGSTQRPYPVAEVVQRVNNEHDDMPVLEPEVDLNQPMVIDVQQDVDIEIQLLRSIEEAARENERLIQTVRHFQEVIEEQTELLERHIQEHLGRGKAENEENEEDEEIDVVTVDDEMPSVDSNGQNGQSSSS
uniref:Uncharacterized protein n=1 Tax=Caenorhabditis tropicalis TaxID=1561998 RepID=A0A1I7TV60_9PELO